MYIIGFVLLSSIVITSDKIPVTLVQVTNQNTQSLVEKVRSTYDSEVCGICKKSGGDVFWYSPFSHGAHQGCFDQIQRIEAQIISLFEKIYPNQARKQNELHIKLIGYLDTNLQDKGFASIKEFHDINNDDALKEMFLLALSDLKSNLIK